MQDPITPLTPQEIAEQEAEVARENYFRRALVTLDIFINVLCGGMPDETISSRASRADLAGKAWGRWMSWFLNLFELDHGAKAQAGDRERAEAILNKEP